MTRTIVALYDDFAAAQRATRELLRKGLARHQISIVANDATGEYSQYISQQATAVSDTIAALGVGALMGGLGGRLVSLGVLMLSGAGSITASGTLVISLIGAGIGAGIGALIGLVRVLANSGIPEQKAHACAVGMHQCKTLVTVRVADDLVDWVINIMDHYQPIDIERRTDQWRKQERADFQSNPSFVEALR